MLNENRLEELDTLRLTKRPLDTYEIGDMFMTMRALWKVARAAQSLLDRTDWTSCLPGEIDNLKEALAALQAKSDSKPVTPKEGAG